MFDARKILIIFLVGVLYSIFSYTLIDAVYPNPEYQDFCKDEFMPAPVKIPTEGYPARDCPSVTEPQCGRNAIPRYNYSKTGCPISARCDYCQSDYETARERHNFIVFIFSSMMGLIALGIGLMLPQKNPMNEWTATGFLLGGLVTIFIGTAIYYGDMARIVRPIVIFAELALVIFLAYRQFRKN